MLQQLLRARVSSARHHRAVPQSSPRLFSSTRIDPARRSSRGGAAAAKDAADAPSPPPPAALMTQPPAAAPLVVAVDGPAASGKGTLARRLAAHFGLRCLDTGLLYRACGAEATRRGVSLDDERAAADVARSLDLSSFCGAADDAAALAHLRSDEAAQAASKVSALPAVRAALLSAQRDFASAGAAVLDGRDIGTVVVPGAAAKVFVTASAEVRAERRWRELVLRRGRRRDPEEGGGGAEEEDPFPPPSLEQVLADLRARDARDEGRAASPLRAADDALVLDTSAMDADAAFEAARAYVEERLSGAVAAAAGMKKVPDTHQLENFINLKKR